MHKFFSMLLLLSLTLVAKALYSQIETNAPYLSVNAFTDARSASLANAVVTSEDDIFAIFINPATLFTNESRNIGATFQKNIGDINSGNIVYVNDQITAGGIWAFTGNYVDFGTFQRADINGVRNGGTFGGSNINLGVSYANELDSNFYYGLTVRYLFAGLENQSSSAMVIDAGLVYEFSDGRSNIGMSLLHAGSVLSTFDGSDFSITPDFRLGFSHRLQGMPLLFNIAIHHLANDYDSFFERFGNVAVGGEFSLGESVKLRGGYDFYTRSNLTPESQGALSGLSFGLGLIFSSMDINLSLNQYGSDALIYRISLNTSI